jgi:hypothetical protein
VITKDPIKYRNYIWIPNNCRKDPAKEFGKAIKSFLFLCVELGAQHAAAMDEDTDETTCLRPGKAINA